MEFNQFPIAGSTILQTTKTSTVNNKDAILLVQNGSTVHVEASDLKNFMGTQKAGIALSPSDPQPTLEGTYLPTENGTYPNADGLEANLSEGYTQFIFDGSNWAKVVTPMPDAKIADWSDESYLAMSQVNYSGEDWVASVNIVSGEVPGISPKWIRRLDMVKGVESNNGNFTIKDINGKIVFRISKYGKSSFGDLEKPTLERLKKELGVTILNDKVYGKKIGILGDSISTTNGAAGVNAALTYIGLLRSDQKCTVFVNAVAGSCVAKGGEATIDFCDDSRWSTLSANTPDIILIFGAINDFLQDIQLGVLGDTDNTKFYGALDYLYKNLLNTNPDARIFHLTPLHTKFIQGGGLIPEFNGQNFLSDYVKAIHEVATRYGVGVIDTNKNSGITCYNIASLSNDLIHVKELGHAMIYNTIVNELNIKLHDIKFSDLVFDIRSNNINKVLLYNSSLNVGSSVPANTEYAATTLVSSANITMSTDNPIGSNCVVIGTTTDGNIATLYLDGSGRIVKFWKDGHVDAQTLYTMPSSPPLVAKGSPVSITVLSDRFTISYAGYSQSILFSAISVLQAPAIGVLVRGSNTYNFTVN